MTTGNSGTDGIIDRHEESRNALKILGCHQTIHLNFADTRAHLQLNDMISAPKTSLKIKFFWCWNHAGIYHAWCRPPSGSSRCLSSFNGCLPHYSTNSRLRNPKYTAFIYASGFESVKEEYFTVKLAALKNIKAGNDAIICVMIACVQLHNFAGNRSIAIWVKAL